MKFYRILKNYKKVTHFETFPKDSKWPPCKCEGFINVGGENEGYVKVKEACYPSGHFTIYDAQFESLESLNETLKQISDNK